jgi:hypothetical protein
MALGSTKHALIPLQSVKQNAENNTICGSTCDIWKDTKKPFVFLPRKIQFYSNPNLFPEKLSPDHANQAKLSSPSSSLIELVNKSRKCETRLIAINPHQPKLHL